MTNQRRYSDEDRAKNGERKKGRFLAAGSHPCRGAEDPLSATCDRRGAVWDGVESAGVRRGGVEGG